jgi:hypothetical protein
MKWSDVRNRFPHKWVLIEAIAAHTEGDRRILDDIHVVGQYANAEATWRAYAEIHRNNPISEMFPVHTDGAELDIRERWELPMRGIRPSSHPIIDISRMELRDQRKRTS